MCGCRCYWFPCSLCHSCQYDIYCRIYLMILQSLCVTSNHQTLYIHIFMKSIMLLIVISTWNIYGFICRILFKQTLSVIKTTSFKTTNLCSTKQPLNAVELKHTPNTRKRNSLLLSSLKYLPHVRITDQPLGSANERLLRLNIKLFVVVFSIQYITTSNYELVSQYSTIKAHDIK